MVFRYFKAGLFLIFTFSLFGFSSVRLTEPHTAQTLGKDNNRMAVSLNSIFLGEGFPFLSIEYTRGLSDNFDLAVFAEKQTSYYPIIGLEGTYQWIHNEPHTLSISMGAGLNKVKNSLTKDNDAKKDEKKPLAKDLLLSFISYIGAIYSFKPNEKYEFAFNIRTHYVYSDVIGNININPHTLKSERGGITISPTHGLYGSANISNTWWMGPSFGATVSLGLVYLFRIWDADGVKSIGNKRGIPPIPKLGFNFHYKF